MSLAFQEGVLKNSSVLLLNVVHFSYFSTNFPPYFLLQWKRHCCRCFVKPGCYLGAVYHAWFLVWHGTPFSEHRLAQSPVKCQDYGNSNDDGALLVSLLAHHTRMRQGAVKQPKSCNWCYISLLVSAQRVEKNIRRLHKNIVLAIQFLLPLIITIIL